MDRSRGGVRHRLGQGPRCSRAVSASCAASMKAVPEFRAYILQPCSAPSRRTGSAIRRGGGRRRERRSARTSTTVTEMVPTGSLRARQWRFVRPDKELLDELYADAALYDRCCAYRPSSRRPRGVCTVDRRLEALKPRPVGGQGTARRRWSSWVCRAQRAPQALEDPRTCWKERRDCWSSAFSRSARRRDGGGHGTFGTADARSSSAMGARANTSAFRLRGAIRSGISSTRASSRHSGATRMLTSTPFRCRRRCGSS